MSDFITQYRNNKLRKSLEKECKSEYSENREVNISETNASSGSVTDLKSAISDMIMKRIIAILESKMESLDKLILDYIEAWLKKTFEHQTI